MLKCDPVSFLRNADNNSSIAWLMYAFYYCYIIWFVVNRKINISINIISPAIITTVGRIQQSRDSFFTHVWMFDGLLAKGNTTRKVKLILLRSIYQRSVHEIFLSYKLPILSSYHDDPRPPNIISLNIEENVFDVSFILSFGYWGSNELILPLPLLLLASFVSEFSVLF